MCPMGHENWINPACGTTVYVIKDSKVLFGTRSSDPGKGKLDAPGGFIEVNESAERAAIRETKEEFGIDITLKNCFGTYPSVYNGRPSLNIVFIASMVDQNQSIVPSDDMNGGEFVWRSMNDLPGPDEVADPVLLAIHADLQAWWGGRSAKP